MKKALLIAAALCMTAPAFASKARKAALGTCRTCADDVQDVWTNAAKMFGFGDMITVEFGLTTGLAAPSNTFGNLFENQAMAEGGIFRSMGDSKWGFYVGHKSTVNALLQTRSGFTMTGIEDLTAPWAFFYGAKAGDMAWAANLSYYAGKSDPKESSGMGIRLGAKASSWEAYFNMGLSAKAVQSATEEYKGNSSMQLGGQMSSGEMVYYADFTTATGTRTNSGTDTKATLTGYSLGAENKMKSDAANVFYGIKYMSNELKDDAAAANSTTVTGLPIYIGIEADATSWLTLRGSVSKPVLVDDLKIITAGTESKTTGASDPTVTLGAAFKWNKLTVDWVVARNAAAASGTGILGTDGFGTNASLTYNF